MRATNILRVELWVLRVYQRIFNAVASRICYTFGVAFATSLGGFLIASYIAIFLAGTIRFEETGTASRFVTLFALLCAFVYAPGYYMHFGLLRPLRVPAFTSPLNLLNDCIHSNRLAGGIDPLRLVGTLAALERLPYHNVLAAMIYPTLVMIAVVAQEVIMGTLFNAFFILTGVVSAIIIYVFFTYITAELLTGPMRKAVKQRLLQAGIDFEEHSALSIRSKFLFISFLFMVAMAELSLMLLYGVGRNHPTYIITFLLMSVFLLAMMLFLYLISIEVSLGEIEAAAVDLGRGGDGRLLLSALDRELVQTGRGLAAASSEVRAIRLNLEEKVAERTVELNDALNSLQEKDRIFQFELDIASRIQRGLMPDVPHKFHGITLEAYYQAMEKVGGDFFDIYSMRDGSLGVVIGDVSGHGVPAALITTMVKIAFTEGVQRFAGPAEILCHVNRSIRGIVKTDEYLTAFFVQITPSYAVRFANAGHHRSLVVHAGSPGPVFWDAPGCILGIEGIDASASFEEGSDQLFAGDRVLLYTDGLVEARNANGELYGLDRLRSVMLEGMNDPLHDARSLLVASLESFVGDADIRDDVTFVLLELGPECPSPVSCVELARACMDDHRYEDALSHLRAAQSGGQNGPGMQRMLGKALFHLQRYEEACHALEQYFALHAGDAGAWFLYAASLYRMGRLAESISAAERVLAVRSEHRQALVVLGLSLKQSGRLHEAADVWRRLLAVDPENKTAVAELSTDKETSSG